MSIETKSLGEIKAAARTAKARWTPGITRLTGLNLADAMHYLGGAIGPEDTPFEEMEQVGHELHDQAVSLRKVVNRVTGLAALTGPAAVPTEVDWRSHNGKSYVTSVKFQGACGTCTCFSTAASAESAICIATNTPPAVNGGVETPDLSEAQSFYCGAAAQGRTCASGWFLPAALAYLQTNGLAPESFFPYSSGDQPCTIKPGWESQAIKITGSTKLASEDEIKTWIATRGPVAIMMVAYDDLFTYTGGVYRPVSTNRLGAHSVSVVGYSDTKSAWLCKNSWSTQWGEQGFFWLGYGECGVGSAVHGINGVVGSNGQPLAAA